MDADYEIYCGSYLSRILSMELHVLNTAANRDNISHLFIYHAFLQHIYLQKQCIYVRVHTQELQFIYSTSLFVSHHLHKNVGYALARLKNASETR